MQGTHTTYLTRVGIPIDTAIGRIVVSPKGDPLAAAQVAQGHPGYASYIYAKWHTQLAGIRGLLLFVVYVYICEVEARDV